MSCADHNPCSPSSCTHLLRASSSVLHYIWSIIFMGSRYYCRWYFWHEQPNLGGSSWSIDCCVGAWLQCSELHKHTKLSILRVYMFRLYGESRVCILRILYKPKPLELLSWALTPKLAGRRIFWKKLFNLIIYNYFGFVSRTSCHFCESCGNSIISKTPQLNRACT